METSPSCTSMTALCRDLSVSTTGTRSGLLVLFVWFPKVTFNWKRGLCNAHLLPPAVAIRSVLSSYSSNDCKLFPTVTELRSRMQSRHLCNQASSVDVETAERIQNVGRLQEDGFCSAESAVWKWNKGRGAPSLKLGRDTFFSLASWPFVLLSPNGSTRPEKAAMHTETCYSLNHARLPSRCWRSRAYTSPIDEMKSFTRFFFFQRSCWNFSFPTFTSEIVLRLLFPACRAHFLLIYSSSEHFRSSCQPTRRRKWSLFFSDNVRRLHFPPTRIHWLSSVLLIPVSFASSSFHLVPIQTQTCFKIYLKQISSDWNVISRLREIAPSFLRSSIDRYLKRLDTKDMVDRRQRRILI